jgi:hypothetical protein
MTRNWAANGGSYVVAIVGLDGRVVAAATARLPSFMPWMPEVNVSGSSVYYMDGDQALRQLSLDGSSRTIAVLPGGPDDRVVVAVEPGALRMAVGIGHLGPDTCPSPPIGPCYPPVSTTLRVERMDGTSVRDCRYLGCRWRGTVAG